VFSNSLIICLRLYLGSGTLCKIKMFRCHFRKISTGPIIPLYARPANLKFIKGEGCYLFDDKNRFLDFTSGIAVNAFGHNHPQIVQIIKDQASKLIHLSNLYGNEYQAELLTIIIRASANPIFFSQKQIRIAKARPITRRLIQTY